MNNSLGERIKDLRKKNNLSQEMLSNKTGISRSNISKIEAGAISPSTNALISLSNYFEISSDYILFGNKEYSKNIVSTLSNDEIEIVNLWKQLSYMNKTIIKGEMFKLIKEESFEDEKPIENLITA